MLNAEQIQLLREIVDNCNDTGAEPRCYSGRGMYGAECLGVVGEDDECDKLLSSIITALIDDVYQMSIDADDTEESLQNARKTMDNAQCIVSALIRGQRRDTMGKQIVVYFPDIDWAEYNPEDEDEDEDETESEENT